MADRREEVRAVQQLVSRLQIRNLILCEAAAALKSIRPTGFFYKVLEKKKAGLSEEEHISRYARSLVKCEVLPNQTSGNYRATF